MEYTAHNTKGNIETAARSAWICQCGHEECLPGHTFGPAVRDHYLLHFVIRGKGILKKKNQEYTISAGEGFLIRPEETTTYMADQDSPWEYYWVGFKGPEAAEILRGFHIDETYPVLRAEEMATVTGLFDEMGRMYNTPSRSHYVLLAHLYLLLQLFHQKQEEEALRRASAVDSYLEQATCYINDNYAYDINVEDVAGHVGIDRTYLYRIFMDHMGVSPVRYLLRVRMERACDLLSKTGLSVYEISLSTGYTDTSHFSGTFKKYFGQSPTQYRRKMWS